MDLNHNPNLMNTVNVQAHSLVSTRLGLRCKPMWGLAKPHADAGSHQLWGQHPTCKQVGVAHTSDVLKQEQALATDKSEKQTTHQ